jgi:MoxR-like ATPase
LPNPFFVIATQNPVDLAGTFPLPDSQLDRFLLRITLGYPDADAEREMLVGSDRRDLIANTMPLISAEDVLKLRTAVNHIHTSPALVGYVQALLAESRRHPQIRVGLSPRAGLALLRAARALALLRGRDYALPEDVQAVFEEVASHRLVPQGETGDRSTLARGLLTGVAVE